MAVRTIIKSINPKIRKKSKPVKVFDEALENLLEDMKDTMRDTGHGAGLSAVQIGVLKRVCVIEANGLYLEMINPEIIKQSGSQICEEGCLSIPDTFGNVKRPMNVTVKALDRHGYEYTISAEDFLAVVMCHEIDHMEGILFTDKLEKELEVKA